jgi:hypothetical protein
MERKSEPIEERKKKLTASSILCMPAKPTLSPFEDDPEPTGRKKESSTLLITLLIETTS